MKTRVQSPDGRTWIVAVCRVRLPGWYHGRSSVEPADSFLWVVWFPAQLIMWFVVPLIGICLLLPVALVRSLVSDTRWIQARTEGLQSIEIIWRTTRERAEDAAAEIARNLARGYEGITPAGAERLFMSEPPGFRDL